MVNQLFLYSTSITIIMSNINDIENMTSDYEDNNNNTDINDDLINDLTNDEDNNYQNINKCEHMSITVSL